MKSVLRRLDALLAPLRALGQVVDLAIRIYVANVFFSAGLVKIGNWAGTLYLFREEYHVPLLPPVAAAWLGAFGELFFPPLLALGLATRFAALSLFFVNVVAVVSFWHVIGGNEAARMTHFYWGLLLLAVLCHGPGKLSLDHWIRTRITGWPDRHP